MIASMSQWLWYARWIETRTLTDEGPFAAGFLPEDYGGPQLDVDLIQRVLVCTQSGHFQLLTFGDTNKVLDDKRATGMGIYIFSGPGMVDVEEIAARGPSKEVVLWTPEINPLLTETQKTAMALQLEAAMVNLEI